MPKDCRILKEPEDIGQLARVLESSEAVNRTLRRFPQLGALIRAINPAADLTRGKLSRNIIAHARLREERQAAITNALATLVKRPVDNFFDIDDLGYTTLKTVRGGTKKIHMNDLMESNLKKFKLTPEQREALQYRRDLWDDLTFDYNRFSERQLVRDEQMFPRTVRGRIDPKTGKMMGERGEVSIGGGARVKTTGSYTRARAMTEDGKILTADEMVEKGWRYHSIDEALSRRAQELGRATADGQLTSWLRKQPYVRTKGQILGANVETGVYPAQPAEKFGGVGDELIDVSPFEAEKIPGLAGTYAPKEIVDYITEYLQRPIDPQIPLLGRAAEESRGLIASFDLGTTGIQLLGALGADVGHFAEAILTASPRKASKIFPTAVKESVESLFNEKNLAEYYLHNKDVIDRWAPYIGGLKNVEYFENLKRAAAGEDIAKVFQVLHTAERPFARAFETALDVAKIEFVKSFESIYGKGLAATDKEVLGAWARNATGTLSTSGLGMSSMQQAIERTWLFFSPRYTRSLFAAVGTLLKMNKAGHEARLALGGLMMAGLVTYWGATKTLTALGHPNEMRLNPLEAGFLSVRLGDNWVGVGGGVKAMARLMANSFEAMREDPSRFISPETRGFDSNPLLSFWRSRTAPLTGVGLDIWQGEDFRGRPIEGVADWGQVLSTRVMPFALQAALEARGHGASKTGIAFISGLGMNTNPMTAYQIYDEYLKNIETADGKQRFPDGAGTVHTADNGFKEFIQADPEARHLRDLYHESRLLGPKPQREMQEILDLRSERLEAAEEYLKKTRDFRGYRSQVNQIRGETRTVMQTLHLDQFAGEGDRKVVQSWYETYEDERAIDPITGGIDSEGLEQVQEEWKLANPGQYERLIRPVESIGETPMETELRQERQYISDSGWWDTDEVVWKQLSGLLAGTPNSLGEYESYQDYLIKKRQEYVELFISKGRSPANAELLATIAMQRDPLIQKFQELRTRERLVMQRDDPTLIHLLNKWGYNSVSLQEYQLAQQGVTQEGYLTTR